MGDRRWEIGTRGRAPGRLRYLLFLIPALLAACATPLRPSGGPEDRTPPQLVASTPTAGAVRVTEPHVRLTFSERVDEASLRRALSVAPAPAGPADVRVRGRDVEITVADSLRADVTYVITLDTELRDLRGVAIAAPITLAFATGARIDRGRIAGSIRDPASGRPVAGAAVLAYHLPGDMAASLPNPRMTRADYRSQTGSDGSFTLSYLRPGPYLVIGLDDRNRNGLAGQGEAYAVPAGPAAVAADNGAAPALAMFMTRSDTTGPALRTARAGAGLVTARFDEPVRLEPHAALAFSIEDSVSSRPAAITGAWSGAEEPREVAIEAATVADVRYTLRLVRGELVRDTSGNYATVGTVSFRGSGIARDTATALFAGFLPEARIAPDSSLVLRPGELAGVRFTHLIDTLRARSRISVRDAAGAPVPFRLRRDDATTVRVETSAPAFIITVGDTTRVRRFRTAAAGELGGLTGRIEPSSAGAVLVEILPEGARRSARYVARADSAGAFAFRGIAPGTYRVRVLRDTDDDGEWDGGSLVPFVSPEPIGWLPGPIRVRARWETDLGLVRLSNGIVTAEGAESEEQGEQ